jgi:hypothetical protein
MTSINPTSSYIRKKGAPDDSPALQGHVGPAQHLDFIWSLLSTPQTVETLHRRIAHDAGAAPSQSAIVSVLKDLLSRDLIEMSPDS